VIRARARHTLALAAGLFLSVAVAAAVIGILPGDVAAREAILAAAPPPVIALLRVANLAGNWRVLFPASLLLLALFPQARPRWWIWLGLMVVAPMTEGTFKFLVGRARPEGTSFGFPSGHSTAAAAFFGAVIYLSAAWPARRRAWARAVAVVGIVLVGLARVALRAHWPSDVVAGVALGLALASLAMLVSAIPPEPGDDTTTPSPAQLDARPGG
jgi:membrane-associated phospholipid phosphatase